jgi:hypothetical protein
MAGITSDGVLFTLDEAIHYAYSASTKEDSPTFKEAMRSPHRDKWLASCVDEICAHTENATWEWAELPPGTSPVGSRFVLKIKHTEASASRPLELGN